MAGSAEADRKAAELERDLTPPPLRKLSGGKGGRGARTAAVGRSSASSVATDARKAAGAAEKKPRRTKKGYQVAAAELARSCD